MKSFKDTFKDKTVLITGHTGFKGSWLSIWLNSLGANVVGISKGLPSNPCNYEVSKLGDFIDSYNFDISESQRIKVLIQETKPDFVFHLAAQALVRDSYKDPLETFSTNAIGTASLLDAFKDYEKNVCLVMITSDKAYDNVEWEWGYKETDLLGGKDPYSASKGMAELVIKSYYNSYFNEPDSKIRIGIARAGNVIGGGDWAKDRIVPDCIKAWSDNREVEIRNPGATRPWQHVLEPLSGYLCLATDLNNSSRLHGEAFNFGPSSDQDFSVNDLILKMSEDWDKVKWKKIVPIDPVHEAGLLKLNCDKALYQLKWKPTLNFEETVKFTTEWYKTFYDNPDDAFKISVNQISQYTELASKRGRIWKKDD